MEERCAEIAMRANRLHVPLRNFHETEANCQCGCGKPTDPELMVRVQAFIYYLERTLQQPVRCLITGPARCDAQNRRVYEGNNPDTYHKGIERIDQGSAFPGAAVDVVMQVLPPGSGVWKSIPKEDVAGYAQESKLFGGVGWRVYGGLFNFVHLDLGPVRTF